MTFAPATKDGLLQIFDERILRECRTFTHTDADDLERNLMGHFTNHFDLLMAWAIAWAMRNHALVGLQGSFMHLMSNKIPARKSAGPVDVPL
jgi:hypothetical protein